MKRPAADGTGTGSAVVTGASSGLGREFALALAERGHPVLAVARRAERLRALADEVGARGDRLEPLVADLSTSAGVDALLARAASLDLALLVNNAGVATYGPFRLDPRRVRAGTRARERRGDRHVHGRAAAGAARPRPRRDHQRRLADGLPADAYFAAYAASKAFVLSFSEALAGDLRSTGVRVTALAPGFVSAEFTEVAGSHAPERRFPHLRLQTSSNPPSTPTTVVERSGSSAPSPPSS
jgi:uncharacterized protein